MTPCTMRGLHSPKLTLRMRCSISGAHLAEAERVDDVAAFERLTLRRDHIRNVYNNQFRGVG